MEYNLIEKQRQGLFSEFFGGTRQRAHLLRERRRCTDEYRGVKENGPANADHDEIPGSTSARRYARRYMSRNILRLAKVRWTAFFR
jgi:hypothetical protein